MRLCDTCPSKPTIDTIRLDRAIRPARGRITRAREKRSRLNVYTRRDSAFRLEMRQKKTRGNSPIHWHRYTERRASLSSWPFAKSPLAWPLARPAMLRLRYQRHCCRLRRGKSKASAIRRLPAPPPRSTIERLFPDNGRFRLTHRITSRTMQVPRQRHCSRYAAIRVQRLCNASDSRDSRSSLPRARPRA
jgi:hypothetical protein